MNWRSILVKAMWFGIFYQSVYIGISKLTSVFLSWFNDILLSSGMSFAQVTLAFIVIGMIMFFIPVIPGVPVYVSGGIIVVNVGWKEMGFWNACIFTTGICCILKGSAIFVQQKGFGGILGKYISIRRTVGVNSVTIKAIKLILSKPGLSAGKVAILCGGPDWPTSVLTGILGLPFPQMLFGSTPVVLLIAPCVITGAVLLRTQEGGMWESLSVVMLGISTLTQMGSMLVALMYIERTIDKHEKEIEAMPNDQEVMAIENEAKAKQKAYQRALDWHQRYNNRFPLSMKIVLCIGALNMSACCYLTTFLGSSCFESFEVSDSISEKLDDNVLNLIIYPLGYLVVLTLGVSVLCLIIFNMWSSRYLRHYQSMVAAAPQQDQHPK